jgi:plasmid stabilization system protein ParE
MRIRTTSAAELDLARAAVHYDLQRLGLGSAFLDEVEKTFAAIAKGPRTYPPLQMEGLSVPENVRFAKTKRFPYLVIFRESADECEVSAIKHAHSDFASLFKRS